MDLPRSLQATHRVAQAIPGWLSGKEGEQLWLWAQGVRAGDVVEVGAWQGRSSVYLAAGLALNEQPAYLFSVDHFEGSPEHQTNGPLWLYPQYLTHLARVGLLGSVAIPIPLSSERAEQGWTRGIGLLFIDGAHDEASVMGDVERWGRHLVSGGRVALHDQYFGGVAAAIDRIKGMGLYERFEEGPENIWSAIKK